MSQAHKGSRLIADGMLHSVDGSTTFLAHYDITENDVIRGIAPISPVATLSPYGQYGGAIAVEKGTINRVINPDFQLYSTGQNIGTWDQSLNYDPIYGGIMFSTWGSGLNGGVTSANVGYHAHGNISRFGYPVVEFVDKNSPYGQKHRWLGLSQQIVPNVSSIGWSAGTKVSVSADLMVDHIDKGIQLGLYHRNPENTTSVFSDDIASLYCTKPYEWQRVSFTATLDATHWNFTQFCNIYIYGHVYKNDYEGTAWVKNVQIETSDFSTSFVKGTRNIGKLAYPRDCMNLSKFTFNAWVNLNDYIIGLPQPVFEYGSPSDINRRIMLSHQSSTNKLGLWNTGQGDIISETIPPIKTWYMVTVTFDGTTYKMYYNGQLINSGNRTAYAPLGDEFLYIGGFMQGQLNGMIDEVRIDNVARSEEEILAWYLSKSPFAPRGIYTVAY